MDRFFGRGRSLTCLCFNLNYFLSVVGHHFWVRRRVGIFCFLKRFLRGLLFLFCVFKDCISLHKSDLRRTLATFFAFCCLKWAIFRTIVVFLWVDSKRTWRDCKHWVLTKLGRWRDSLAALGRDQITFNDGIEHFVSQIIYLYLCQIYRTHWLGYNTLPYLSARLIRRILGLGLNHLLRSDGCLAAEIIRRVLKIYVFTNFIRILMWAWLLKFSQLVCKINRFLFLGFFHLSHVRLRRQCSSTHGLWTTINHWYCLAFLALKR